MPLPIISLYQLMRDAAKVANRLLVAVDSVTELEKLKMDGSNAYLSGSSTIQPWGQSGYFSSAIALVLNHTKLL